MRIVIDLQGAQTESRYRGIGRYTLSFAQAVVRNRGQHEIFLALSGLFPDTIEQIRAAFDGLLPQENIRVWSAPGPISEAQLDNEVRQEVAEALREAFLKSLHPDVIHMTSLFEGFLDDAATSIGVFDTTTPVSVSLYDLIPLLNPDQYLKPNPRYERFYMRKVDFLRKASAYLAISKYSREEAVRALGISDEKVLNISSAIEACFVRLNMGQHEVDQLKHKFGISKSFVLYTGGSDERKNLPRLIQAYAGLSQDIRGSHQLVLAGKISKNEIANFFHIAQSAGLHEGELRFTGHISDEELVKLYNICDLYVLPSWHEGFGLPVLEAMACGAPVICANASSLPEVIGFKGALFDPFDVGAITEKITHALTDDGFRTLLREHGTKQVKNFSWDLTAQSAIQKWELLKNTETKKSQTANRKPRLAFVSPLPPERTGVADYSADLLPALAEYYEIDVVVAGSLDVYSQSSQAINLRDVAWLRANASNFDRVVYQMGNSPFHHHMLSLLQEVPGVVVLHDFFLGDLFAWMEMHNREPHEWTKSLYESHGYGAVKNRFKVANAAKSRFPANWGVLKYARGVIVHSEFARNLGLQWYGNKVADSWEVIPLLRSQPIKIDKKVARERLGIEANIFLVCSFGYLDETKLNDRLIKAWLDSNLAADQACNLVFVGENNGGSYGSDLRRIIGDKGNNIRITGYVDHETYNLYLAAADCGVQLRKDSKGESSAAILDCMNYGLPVIANAGGTFSEINSSAIQFIAQDFSNQELVNGLEIIKKEPELRLEIGSKASAIILERHSPKKCAERYMLAIEKFLQAAPFKFQDILSSIKLKERLPRNDVDLRSLSKVMSETFPLTQPVRRLFLDLTATCEQDLGTGIERVAKSLAKNLIDQPPSGYRIEPVFLTNKGGFWNYRYARSYTLDLLGLPSEILDNEVIDPVNGDILLTLDISGAALIDAEREGLYRHYRDLGVSVYAVVYDLLPVRMPQVFPPGVNESHANWLRAISQFDGAICISKAVENDLATWQREIGIGWDGRRPYNISNWPLGADLFDSFSNKPLPSNAQAVLNKLRAAPSFLMVGTLEPRKGYLQTLEAFTELWKSGSAVNLVIVGREGWKGLPDEMRREIPGLIQAIRNHPELNERLFWLDGISDEYLRKIYEASTCLIAASFDEGFGLPLIESALNGLPIIARDIPVFREVAGDCAYYFQGNSPESLAEAIGAWLVMKANQAYPKSKDIAWITWHQSAKLLADTLIKGNWTNRQVGDEIKARAIREHLTMIHLARIQMVSTLLPAGEIILDLGGANCPLYLMGYPHAFKKLYLIDLPPEDRCDMYKEVSIDSNHSGTGEIVIKYGDMTELDAFSDESVDFVWSGQSIEHIPFDAGLRMCKAVYRVLKKGGAFCLDTPNRLITEIHTQDIGGGFIHPEHFIEYTPIQLQKQLEDAGFLVRTIRGVCEMPITAAGGKFDYTDFIYGDQISDRVDQSYIQYFHCEKI